MTPDNSRVKQFFEEFEKSEEGELLMDRLKRQCELHLWDARHYDQPLFCNKCGGEFSDLVALALQVPNKYLIICQECLDQKPAAKDIFGLLREFRKLEADDIQFELEDLDNLAVQEEI